MAPYPEYPLLENEEDRLRALERVLLLETDSDPNLDRIVRLASEIFHTPIALISLVEQERQWFLSRIGLEASETPRSMAFCAHAITGDQVLMVPDARQDHRFDTNPLVSGDPGIRFYAGAPLTTADGQRLGTLCVIDRVPHHLDDQQQSLLQMLSQQVVRELELRHQASRCPVSGLFNRPSFLHLGQKEFERARRTGSSLSLITLLVDPPPAPTGSLDDGDSDRWFLRVAELCRRHGGEADLLGRLGHRELALLIVVASPRSGPQDRGLEIADALPREVAMLEDDGSGDGQPPGLRIGLSHLKEEDEGFSDLLIRCDNALCLAAPKSLEVL